jgi:hypothetical protein
MSCAQDLCGTSQPTEGEDVPTYLNRCRPSRTGGLAVGAVAPSFPKSNSDLVAVAREWLAAYDGCSSMLAFGAARGLTFGAWQLCGVAPAEADTVWAMAVSALTTGQLGVYCAMAPQDDGSWTLRVGTPDFADKHSVDGVLASLRAMGYDAACEYTAVTYLRRGDDCVVGHEVVWQAAKGAVTSETPASTSSSSVPVTAAAATPAVDATAAASMVPVPSSPSTRRTTTRASKSKVRC